MSWKTVMKEAQTAFKQAQTLVEERSDNGVFESQEDADQFEALYAEAEEKREKAQELKVAEERQNRLGSMAGMFGDGGRQTEDDPEDAGNNPATGNVPAPPETRHTPDRALYETRWGPDLDGSVGLLARDLYGQNYPEVRMAAWGAFHKYLRRGEDFLSVEQRNLLRREPILTPGQLTSYAQAGIPFSEVRATLVEATDSLGGVLVPEDVRMDIIKRLMGFTVMRQRARVVGTQRDAVEWPALRGGNDRYTSAVRVTWVNETPTAGTAASNPTFGSERIPIHTAMIETFLSRNLIEDVATDIVGLLTELFAEAAAIDEDEQFLVGDGVGKPHGLLPSNANSNSLSEVATGSAAALTSDGLIKMKRGIARQYRGPAVWIMNSDAAEKIELLQDGESRYRFDLSDDELLRKPVLEDEAMPDVAADSFSILYGDPRGYVIADRIGMSVERYIDSATARINQVVYVMRRRLGGKLVEPFRWVVQKTEA